MQTVKKDLKKRGMLLLEVYNKDRYITGIPEWHLGRTLNSLEELIQWKGQVEEESSRQKEGHTWKSWGRSL